MLLKRLLSGIEYSVAAGDIDGVDISRVASVLEPNYGAQSVSVFAKIMFGLVIDPESLKGL